MFMVHDNSIKDDTNVDWVDPSISKGIYELSRALYNRANLHVQLFLAINIKMVFLLFLSKATVVCITGKEQTQNLWLVGDHRDVLKLLHCDGGRFCYQEIHFYS